MRVARPLVGGGIAALSLCAAVLAVGNRLPPAGAAACVLAFMSLVYPAVGLGMREPRSRFVLAAAALAGGFVGILAFMVILSPGAIPAALASMLVIAAATASLGALGASLSPFLGRRAGPALAGGALAAFVALPFWSASLFVRGHWVPGWLLISASPFLSAMLPWTAGGEWQFDPRTSPVLYDVWVGTDVPLALPSWTTAFLFHAALALALVGAMAVSRRVRS